MEPATTYNPLFIYGNSGLGKTHLLYAIINYIRKNHPNLKIVYKKSEDFINELITALVVNKNTAEFKNKYRSADVLLIDDIQFIAGKESTQDEFFHTFSALYEAGKQIILTSDRPPKEIKPLSDRLRTRFEGGLLADVQKPSFELRIAIIKKKSAALNMSISNELINYMAERLQHDIRQIEGALKKLKALYLINGLSITKESIDNVISSIDPGNIPTDVLVEKILTTVAKYYGVRVEEILSKSKTDNIAYARHISVYVIKKLTDLSYKAIGSFIGGRDHSTVISSYNKVEQYISTKKNTESDIKKIIRDVKG
jgi:chromosomal replication initiator protein